MVNKIKKIFIKENIEYASILNINDCCIINERLFERKTPFAKSVIIFLVPYFAGEKNDRNISLYAVSRNYHDYLEFIFEKVISELKEEFPEHIFTGMGDHSPIAETRAAACAGLGIIGDNYRLINEKYGSYVFIGGIFTDLTCKISPKEIQTCNHCGACRKSCPSPENCLSAITQRKGELTEDEIAMMIKYNTAWGCDICQMVCPMNKKIEQTPIDFFKNELIYHLTPEILGAMSDDELAHRAFGWKKRKTIERNIKLLSNK